METICGRRRGPTVRPQRATSGVAPVREDRVAALSAVESVPIFRADDDLDERIEGQPKLGRIRLDRREERHDRRRYGRNATDV